MKIFSNKYAAIFPFSRLARSNVVFFIIPMPHNEVQKFVPCHSSSHYIIPALLCHARPLRFLSLVPLFPFVISSPLCHSRAERQAERISRGNAGIHSAHKYYIKFGFPFSRE
jgi:hypothetical protein